MEHLREHIERCVDFAGRLDRVEVRAMHLPYVVEKAGALERAAAELRELAAAEWERARAEGLRS